jgi:hypothetical protein
MRQVSSALFSSLLNVNHFLDPVLLFRSRRDILSNVTQEQLDEFRAERKASAK